MGNKQSFSTPLEDSIKYPFLRFWMLGSFEPSEGISSFIEDGSIQADNPGLYSNVNSHCQLNFRHLCRGKAWGREEGEAPATVEGSKATYLYTISSETNNLSYF